VLSELRKGERADAGARSWFVSANDAGLFVSVLVLGEIRQGVERKRRRAPAAARDLDRWLEGLIEQFATRILSVDSRVAEQWGRLLTPGPLPAVDALIAATALVHDLTVVTGNVRDFVRTGAKVLNPFER
jgi:toxin FitB